MILVLKNRGIPTIDQNDQKKNILMGEKLKQLAID